MDSDNEEDYYVYQAERKSKQNYLREEIIDAGYNPELFTYFIEQRKGADIDLWTFEELQDAVNDFKVSYQSGQSLEEIQSEEKKRRDKEDILYKIPQSSYHIPATDTTEDVEEDQPEEQVGSADEEQEPPQEENKFDDTVSSVSGYEKYIPERDQDEIYTLAGQHLPETDLSRVDNLDVQVSKPEIKKGGMFSKDYVVYQVTTLPFNWVVPRRFSDFAWLRDVLATIFPGYYIPPPPPKKAISRTKQDTITKRQRFLQRFISAVARNPIFRNSQIFLDFLKEENAKRFESIKTMGKKLKRPDKLREFPSIDGQIWCDPNPNESYYKNLYEYLFQSENIAKKLKRQSQEVQKSVNALVNQIKSYSQLIQDLGSIQHFLPGLQGNTTLYSNLSEKMMAWSQFELDQISNIKEYFNMFFKFKYNEVQPLSELLKERESLLSNLNKSEGKLLAKKQKLWNLGDVTKFGITQKGLDRGAILSDKDRAMRLMLPKETNPVIDLKNRFAFYNHQAHKEADRVLMDSTLLDNIHFAQYGRKVEEDCEKLKAKWAEFEEILGKSRVDEIPDRPYVVVQEP